MTAQEAESLTHATQVRCFTYTTILLWTLHLWQAPLEAGIETKDSRKKKKEMEIQVKPFWENQKSFFNLLDTQKPTESDSG